MIEKYKFRKYDKKYPELFRREKIRLRKIIGGNPNIEHVGSTAVPNLGGKGVLDLMISVNKKEINKIKKQLEKAGYVFKESGGERDRLFFTKNYKHLGKIRVVHLQLTPRNSYIFKRMIKFRDCLIKDKQKREEYCQIKKQAVKISNGDGKIYRKHKENFIKVNQK